MNDAPALALRPTGFSPWGSLAMRLVAFAVTVVSLTAGSVGWLSYGHARRALEGEATSRLRLVAANAADDITRDLAGRTADVTNWSQLPVMRAIRIRDVDHELNDLLGRLLTGHSTWTAIVCVDASGKPIASAGDAAAVRWQDLPDRARISLLQADEARPARLQFAVPVSDPDHPGSTIGALLSVVDATHLLPSPHERGTADSSNIAVRIASATQTIAASKQDEGPMLAGSALVGAPQQTPCPPFEVTVTEPTRSALAGVATLRTILLRTGAAALVIASLLAAWVAWQIARPIRRLTHSVQNITDTGELTHPVDVLDRGEVGTLALAFEQMLTTVREQHAQLLVQSRVATLGEIAASVAHEVRTPLSVLKTSAQLLERPGLPAEEQRQLAGMMRAEVDRLNGVVTDLVDLARPRPAEMRVESVRTVVERAVRFFTPTAQRLGIDLRLDPVDPTLLVRANRDQIHQVLVNLLHNALQATTRGGHVVVAVQPAERGVTLTVADDGPGFSEVVLAHLFTRFRTTKADGTGLGLAISKRIIEEHGGRISAGSGPQRGAEVRFWLPRPSGIA